MSESNLLRDQVKISTEKIHRYVEGAPIMLAILNGNLERNDYVKYLVDIYAIYKVLGDLLSTTPLHHWISGHYLKVKSDLDVLCTDMAYPECSLQCLSYLQYLQSVHLNSNQNYARCIAHVYVRVLADLSGGIILKKKLHEHVYPTQTYEFNNGLKDEIITWINLPATDKNAFTGDAHMAFLSYVAILRA